jgi:uncharacterized protein involved in type VI secretion and phage assembly
MLMKKIKALVICAVALFHSASFAVVECNVTPYNYYTGEGIFWIQWFQGGKQIGSGHIAVTDPTYKTVAASVMLAVASGKNMIVRYADGQSCTSEGVKMLGVWSIK